MAQRIARAFLFCMLLLPGCFPARVLNRVLALPHDPKRVANKITEPWRMDARLSVLWVGHATALIQIDDRFVLTDPVFTRTVGEVSPRLVEPGILPQHLPSHLVAVVSHLHFDHLSYDSLEMLRDKIDVLMVPSGARANLPRYQFVSYELQPWETHEEGGLRVTAVPVRHTGGRLVLDNAWNPRAFTGYVFEYHGIFVYFGGDTVYDGAAFAMTQQRFPTLDLALLPICPAEPRSFMRRAHMDPAQSLDAFAVLGAKRMVPIHFDTFINSDDHPGDCSIELMNEMSNRGIGLERVQILAIGEQRVLMAR